MAGANLDLDGADLLGLLTQHGRGDGGVLGGDDEPARARPPGGLGDRRGEGRHGDGHLRVAHEGGVRVADVGGEPLLEAFGADEAESVGLFLDHEGRGDAEALILVPGRLADIGGQGGDIDQALHLFVDAGLGDHHAAPRVADKNGSAVLAGEGAPRGGHVVGQGGEGVLDDGHPVAASGQVVIDGPPARAVGEGAVNQDDVADGLSRRNRLDGLGLSGSADAGGADGGEEDVAELDHGRFLWNWVGTVVTDVRVKAKSR